MLATILSSCNNTHIPTPDGVCEDHVDSDGDGKCDECEADVPGDPEPEKPESDGTGDDQLPDEIVYDTTILIQTVEDTAQGLTSLTHKYLAGDNDTAVYATMERNRNARDYAGVNVEYTYVPNNRRGSASRSIVTLAQSMTEAGRPDIFHNYTYDIIAASLLGVFANLYSEQLHQPQGYVDVENNFSFAKGGAYDENCVDTGSGYMIEYMRSLSTSDKKVYALASDYFIDTVASSLVIPVNVELLETITPSADPNAYNYDADGDGVYELSDFYALVYSDGWDHEALKSLAGDVEAGTGGADQLDGVHGFAVSSSILSAAGLIYTTGISVANKRLVPFMTSDGELYEDYEYWYPEEPDELMNVFDALCSLFTSDGITLVNSSDYAATPDAAIRLRFSEGAVLFGGITHLGMLDSPEYMGMISTAEKGYGIAPLPLLKSGAGDYLTLVYFAGRVGAITKNTSKFAECSAFLDYQSRNSSAVIDAYYDELLSDGEASNLSQNRDMLDFVRAHIGDHFEYNIEEQMLTDSNTAKSKWEYLFYSSGFATAGMDIYMDYYSWLGEWKNSKLSQIVSDIQNHT